MKITKVFKSGNSLAVRLPKEFRITSKEVYITKKGCYIILTPKDKKWDALFEKLKEVKEETRDFLAERNQPLPQEKEEL